jgi:eukaryotic-like serine/threonine-protein kinase
MCRPGQGIEIGAARAPGAFSERSGWSARAMVNALTSGAELDGFTLGARVYTGGMGTLFRVTKAGIDRPLVMKVPRVGPHEPREGIIAFEMEAMIAAALKGPHVPAFVAVGDLARTPYLVSEWIEGRTLEDVLEGGALAPPEVAQIGAALADALHSLHQQGVVHLDVKPENAILRADGTVVLIDFGLAHHSSYPDLLAEETRFGVGSAPYVSPEQLAGTREDRRSDVFALGVVLYEMATGKLPFGEPDADVRNRLWIDPVPPSTIAPAVPQWMQEIILRSIEPRADLRYQSAAHVAFDLRHPAQVTLTGRATKSERAGLVSHLGRFLRARAEHGAHLRARATLSRMPIVLAAIDTAHLEDERHHAIRFVVSQILELSEECRVMALSVISPSAPSLEHLVKLRSWADPLGLPIQRLTVHAIEASAPADVIVDLARHNNVDLVVVGAPAEGGRAWSRSVASAVTARVTCSVHVVRVPKGSRGSVAL